MTATTINTRLLITEDAEAGARALADGGVVAHAFGNFYAITTRADKPTVHVST